MKLAARKKWNRGKCSFCWACGNVLLHIHTKKSAPRREKDKRNSDALKNRRRRKYLKIMQKKIFPADIWVLIIFPPLNSIHSHVDGVCLLSLTKKIPREKLSDSSCRNRWVSDYVTGRQRPMFAIGPNRWDDEDGIAINLHMRWWACHSAHTFNGLRCWLNNDRRIGVVGGFIHIAPRLDKLRSNAYMNGIRTCTNTEIKVLRQQTTNGFINFRY